MHRKQNLTERARARTAEPNAHHFGANLPLGDYVSSYCRILELSTDVHAVPWLHKTELQVSLRGWTLGTATKTHHRLTPKKSLKYFYSSRFFNRM